MSTIPIKLENNVASVNVVKTIKLKPRQLATIKYMQVNGDTYGAQRYLESLMGFVRSKIHVDRLKFHGRDELAKSPGSVLKDFQALLNNRSNVNHRPTQRNVGQWIGVEIECYIPIESNDDGDDIDEMSYYHDNLRDALKDANITRVSVKQDGSLSDEDGMGVEVTLLFNSADGFGMLEKLLRVLNDVGCYVNDNCGLHVHLDARHLKRGGVMRIGRRLGRALPILKYMVDKSRHDNVQYCKMGVSPFTKEWDDRYHAVNLVAYSKFRTIEVRLHGGTTSFKKIKNWIETLQFLANKRMPVELTTFQDFIDTGIPAHLVEYADKRITSLNPEAWTILTPVPVLRCDANGRDSHGNAVSA